MLYTIVVLSKGGSRVIGRINEDALYLTEILVFQRLESQEVVAMD
jgi:hypothetical protein